MSVLAVRGPNGVYDAEWAKLPENEAIEFLNNLLNTLLPQAVPEGLETPDAVTEEPVVQPSATP